MTPPPRSADLTDHLLDLVVGSSCLGCARPGRMLCRECRARLPAVPAVRWPCPSPPGLAVPWAAGEHVGLLRRLVIDHKEESRFGLAEPLGSLLAGAVGAALAVPGGGVPGGAVPEAPAVLVPVPSRPGVARRRGDDPTRRLVDRAAAVLAARGVPVVVAPLLRSHRGVRDQSELDAGARAHNLAGSMWVPSGRLRTVAARGWSGPVVVCDDVLTTGATAREAQRALAGVGVPVAAVAVVSAARRRHGPTPAEPV